MDAAVTDAITDGFGSLTTLATTTVVPAVFGITLLGVGVALAVKAIRKNGTKVA